MNPVQSEEPEQKRFLKITDEDVQRKHAAFPGIMEGSSNTQVIASSVNRNVTV